MLESKGRTGTTQTKSWYHLKWKFPSFVLSQASLAFQYSDFVPREPLAVNSPFMRLFSSHMWPTPPLTPQATLNAYLQNYSGVLTMYGIFGLKGNTFLLRQQKMTGISNIASLSQGPLSRIVASQHPASRASLSEEEKKRLCLNHVKPFRSPQPELLD